MKSNFITSLFLVFFSTFIYAQDWVYIGSILEPGMEPSISVPSPNVAWVVGGIPSMPKVFRTLDGGVTWELISTTGIGQQLYCIGAINDLVAFAGEGVVNGNAKLYKTTDGGASWTIILQTTNNGGHFTGIAFTKARQNLFGLAIAERIYRTSDSGQNWVVLSAGTVGVSNAHNSLMITDNNFYGFGLNNGAPRVRMTTDNASSWTTSVISVTGNYTSAIAFHSNKYLGIAATSTSMPFISRTTDGGITWANIDVGPGLTGNCYATWIPDGPVIYLMGENGGIKRSTDNGLTWVTMSTAGVSNLKHFDFAQLNNVVYGYAISSDSSVIKLVDTLGVLTGSINSSTPVSFALKQNYPNPFNPATEIEYSVPKSSYVKLLIYDALGREISNPVKLVKSAGNYKISFDGSNLNSGVYFYRLQAGEFSQTRKMILLK